MLPVFRSFYDFLCFLPKICFLHIPTATPYVIYVWTAHLGISESSTTLPRVLDRALASIFSITKTIVNLCFDYNGEKIDGGWNTRTPGTREQVSWTSLRALNEQFTVSLVHTYIVKGVAFGGWVLAKRCKIRILKKKSLENLKKHGSWIIIIMAPKLQTVPLILSFTKSETVVKPLDTWGPFSKAIPFRWSLLAPQSREPTALKEWASYTTIAKTAWLRPV